MAIKWDNPDIGTNTGGGITWDYTASLSDSQNKYDQLLADMRASKEAAQKAQSPLGIAEETAKGTAGTLLGGLQQFVTSAIKAPRDIYAGLTGKKIDTSTYTDISGEQKQTIQGEVASGKETPLGAVAKTGLEAADVLSLGMGGKLAKMGFETAKTLAEKTGLKEMVAKGVERKALKSAVRAITPKLTPTEMKAEALKGKGYVPKVGAPKIDFTKDKHFMEIAKNVKGLVRGKSAIEDINSIKDAIGIEAENLKKAIKSVDHPYTFKELEAKLSNVEEPISIRGTQFEKQIGLVKQSAMDIAKKNGGTISSLLDTRKEFDELVNKEYPHIWEKEYAPIRNAITKIRNEMNDFIESNLPDDVAFKESLKKQRLFYEAMENIGTKVPDEIRGGATFAKRHPKFIDVAKMGGSILGYETLKKELENK